MGQGAALVLSELLLLLAASRTLLAVSFPEDSVPLDVVDAHCEYARGEEAGAEPRVSLWPQRTSVKDKTHEGRLRHAVPLRGQTKDVV